MLYTQRLSEIGAKFESGAAAPQTLDFADLAGGAWISACLLGGYTDPIGVMRTQGASITAEDEERIGTLRTLLGPDIVEEFDAMIAYTDLGGAAHFIYFDRGIGTRGQHFAACATKPKTMIYVYPTDDRERP